MFKTPGEVEGLYNNRLLVFTYNKNQPDEFYAYSEYNIHICLMFYKSLYLPLVINGKYMYLKNKKDLVIRPLINI